jgi:hypothetical protein
MTYTLYLNFTNTVARGLAVSAFFLLYFAPVAAQYEGGFGDGFSTNSEEDAVMLPLPLDLISFTAEAEEDVVVLNWTTQNEVATSHFEIERSIAGATFENIGRVAAAGTSAPDAQLNYEFRDPTAPAGSILYRLKMIDLDLSFTYSPIKQVRVDVAANVSVGVFPNPSNGTNLNFRVNGLDEGAEVEVDLIDQVGRRISSGTFVVQPGAAVNFPLERALPNGAYTVRVSNPKLGSVTQKLSVN